MPDYLVTQRFQQNSESPIFEKERVVNAPNRSMAIRFVSLDCIDAEVISIEHAMRLAKEGVEIERTRET